MAYILGFDPSEKKSGYCVIDTNLWVPGKSGGPHIVESGRLRTSTSDGFTLLRLMRQQEMLNEVLDRFDINFICMENSVFNSIEGPLLFALNQFIHKVFYDRGSFLICIPPAQLKHIAWPDKPKGVTVNKPQMIHRYWDIMGNHGTPISDDEADAFWLAYTAVHFYHWYFSKELPDKYLPQHLQRVFFGKTVGKRGVLEGNTNFNGLLFRENELLYDYTKIKSGRAEHGFEFKKIIKKS